MENENPKRSASEENSAQNSKTEVMAEQNEIENDKIDNKNGDSEYESIESSGDSDNEDENDYESEGSVILEREEGDGQESISTKKVDDDEDKKNPQYIPKRGTFYEHDDRTLEDSEDKEEVVEKTEKQNKKNVWMEKKERWSHDRYNDNEQAPKSRSELVAIYGYDIRNEDGPPKARRRRRYGRGPNKYTRTWEDEDAYKAAKAVKPIKPKIKSKEDYSSLPEKDEEQKERTLVKDKNMEKDSSNQQLEPSHTEHEAPPDNVPKLKVQASKKVPFTYEQSSARSQQLRVGTGRIVKHKPEPQKEIKDSDYKGFTKTRQFRNSKSEQKILPKNSKMEGTQKHLIDENTVDGVEKDLSKVNIQDDALKLINKQSNHRQNSVPPRLQAEQKGSKRYSSLRQRSLPETAVPTFTQAANYYANEYTPPTPAVQQPPLLPQQNAMHPPTPQVPQIAPPPLPLAQQVSVTTNPILQAPPQFAPTFPQPPPAFLPPAVATPSFIPQQPPQIINYVQSQPQFTQAPPFQGYQHQQFNAVNQPAELYQCQGGTTYYSTQNQHLGQRLVPQKRPKAAIPIVPPPPQEPRGRGRSNNFRESPLQGDDICEIIMHENNANYEDSIVYVQQ